MKFEKLEKISGGAFLHRYDITYSDEKDRRFTYEMVSRDPQLDSFEKLRAHKPDAVVMALTDRAGERFVLIHEFRLELGRRIYGLPGGLIDKVIGILDSLIGFVFKVVAWAESIA